MSLKRRVLPPRRRSLPPSTKKTKTYCVSPNSLGLRVNCDDVSVLVTRDPDGAVRIVVATARASTVVAGEGSVAVRVVP